MPKLKIEMLKQFWCSARSMNWYFTLLLCYKIYFDKVVIMLNYEVIPTAYGNAFL